MPIFVLVVDDEPEVRLLAADRLRSEGFCVMEACDTKSAVALIGANPGIEVLFTDIEMPGTDGFALAVLAVLLSPRVHVLYTSGCARLNDRRREHSIPAEMLAKPYRLDQMTRAVRDAYRCPLGDRGEAGLPLPRH
jgi:DNA-binding NtrC family response regulator